MRWAACICLHPIVCAWCACRRIHIQPAINVCQLTCYGTGIRYSFSCALLPGASQACWHAQDTRHPAHNPHLCQRQGCALDRFKSQHVCHTASAAATPIPQNAHLHCLPTHFPSRRLCSATWRASSSCTPPTPKTSTGCWYRFDMVNRYKRQLGGYEARYGAGCVRMAVFVLLPLCFGPSFCWSRDALVPNQSAAWWCFGLATVTAFTTAQRLKISLYASSRAAI